MPETPNTIERPKEGEQTKPQSGTGGTVAGVTTATPGFGEPPPGLIDTYRRMRTDPTIALARAVATAPIKAANASIEPSKEAPKGAADLIESMVLPSWDILVRNAVFALDYGFQSFEQVWEIAEGVLWIKKHKPLNPSKTKILVDEHGIYAGLKQDSVELLPTNTFLFSYDMECGNLYGRSRQENCRSEWHRNAETGKRQDKYVNKVAGVTVGVEYPEGRGKDRNGVEKDNWELAEQVVKSFGSGQGVTMPNTLSIWANEFLKRGVDIDKLHAWRIIFHEPRGQHGQSFVAIRKHLESLLMRGWLVPERAATEGQFGTKAEASAHADLALLIAQETLDDIVRHMNSYIIDRILSVNYGPDAVGTVELITEPLVNEAKSVMRDIIVKVLSANADLVTSWIDVDAVLNMLGLPRPETETVLEPTGDVDDMAALSMLASAFRTNPELIELWRGNGDGGRLRGLPAS